MTKKIGKQSKKIGKIELIEKNRKTQNRKIRIDFF